MLFNFSPRTLNLRLPTLRRVPVTAQRHILPGSWSSEFALNASPFTSRAVVTSPPLILAFLLLVIFDLQLNLGSLLAREFSCGESQIQEPALYGWSDSAFVPYNCVSRFLILTSDIASMLLSEGFSGVFASSSDVTDPGPPENVGGSLPEFSIPWPSLGVSTTQELLFPTRLEARSPCAFSLWSPGPTILPLVDLLRSYTQLGTEIPNTISFLYLWTRSFGLHEFTPTCLALMVIASFQVRLHLPLKLNHH